jgi:hypothetical protein
LVIPALVTILPDIISVSLLLTRFEPCLSPLMAAVLRRIVVPKRVLPSLVISLALGGLSEMALAKGHFG